MTNYQFHFPFPMRHLPFPICYLLFAIGYRRAITNDQTPSSLLSAFYFLLFLCPRRPPRRSPHLRHIRKMNRSFLPLLFLSRPAFFDASSSAKEHHHPVA